MQNSSDLIEDIKREFKRADVSNIRALTKP